MPYEETINETVQTSLTSRPSSPQITVRNPLDTDIYVNGIEIIPEPEFSKKGRIIITVNGINVYASQSQSLFGYAKFPVPLSKTLKRSHDIQVYAWNDADTNSITCRFNLSLSLNPAPFQSQAVPIDRDVFNSVVSQSEIILPQSTYKDVVVTTLINLEGYKRFWALISAQVYVPPVILSDGGFTNPDNSIDGDTATFASLSKLSSPQSGVFGQEFDFGAVMSTIHIKADMNQGASISSTPVQTYFRIFEKTLIGDSWSQIYEDFQTVAYPNPNLITTYDFDIATTGRYFKVEWTNILNNGSLVMKIYEVYDPEVFGGTVALSFEIKDSASGLWLESIPSSEFGTVSQGQNVAVQIGDTLTKKYALPSSQTDFRAKMTIVGGLNTGVSILKVA